MWDNGVNEQRMAERMASARDLGERIARMSATATSADHAVSVEVGPGGAILDLTLTDRSRHLSGKALGETIVRTIDQATASLRETLEAAIAEVPGMTPNLATIVSGELPEFEFPVAGTGSRDRSSTTRP